MHPDLRVMYSVLITTGTETVFHMVPKPTKPSRHKIPGCIVGTTEDEMVGWHHRLNGHEFEQALQDVQGQGSLACCSP